MTDQVQLCQVRLDLLTMKMYNFDFHVRTNWEALGTLAMLEPLITTCLTVNSPPRISGLASICGSILQSFQPSLHTVRVLL